MVIDPENVDAPGQGFQGREGWKILPGGLVMGWGGGGMGQQLEPESSFIADGHR